MKSFLILLACASSSLAHMMSTTSDPYEWMECPVMPWYPTPPIPPPISGENRTESVCMPNRKSHFYCKRACGRNYLLCDRDRDMNATEFTCPDHKPYCNALGDDRDHCSSKIPEGCEDELIDFKCTSTGPFPNPNDCTSYYFCKRHQCYSIKPSFVECEKGEIFDPERADSSFCVTATQEAQLPANKTAKQECPVVSCKGKPDGFQFPIRHYKRHYAICKSEKIYSYQCPENYVVDTSEVPAVCTFKCTSEGNFVHIKNRKKYYYCKCPTCEPKEKTCPGLFNATTTKCSTSRILPFTLPDGPPTHPTLA